MSNKYLDLNPKKRSGNSTRLMDFYIQELFKNDEVKVIDHVSTIRANEDLALRIERRMFAEHPNTPISVNFNPKTGVTLKIIKPILKY